MTRKEVGFYKLFVVNLNNETFTENISKIIYKALLTFLRVSQR